MSCTVGWADLALDLDLDFLDLSLLLSVGCVESTGGLASADDGSRLATNGFTLADCGLLSAGDVEPPAYNTHPLRY